MQIIQHQYQKYTIKLSSQKQNKFFYFFFQLSSTLLFQKNLIKQIIMGNIIYHLLANHMNSIINKLAERRTLCQQQQNLINELLSIILKKTINHNIIPKFVSLIQNFRKYHSYFPTQKKKKNQSKISQSILTKYQVINFCYYVSSNIIFILLNIISQVNILLFNQFLILLFLQSILNSKTQTNMCFLKDIDRDSFYDFQKMRQEDRLEQAQTTSNIYIPYPHKSYKPIQTQQHNLLTNLIQRLQKNNFLIQSMNNTIKIPSQIVENNSIQPIQIQKINNIYQIGSNQKNQDALSSTIPDNLTLCTRLFGFQKYKYFLQLDQKFPKIIYKQRNFNLFIKLMNTNNTIIRNCNILSLCCAISTSDAQWIHQNRIGEPFMKGKTQVQLYKGEASFIKLYVRDVSRVYPDGKVNLIIYTKPSILLYSRSNSYQTIINSNDIKPLIIQQLIIKAKKKQ